MNSKATLLVEGMTCSNCAQNITRQLQKNGLKNVLVNFEEAEVTYDEIESITQEDVINTISSLGYKASANVKIDKAKASLTILEKRLIISSVFTLPLLLHMWINWHWLHHPIVQLLLCMPVVIIGCMHFGRSAWGSIKHRMPNMDVLITVGASSAFIYSLIAIFLFWGEKKVNDYLFFETAATIITLVLLGNLIEQRSLRRTTTALDALIRLQPQTAKRIIDALTDNERSEEVLSKNLKLHDLVLINTGERIPVDGRIYWGSATIDESAMTGESVPSDKSENDTVLAGTIISKGSIKVISDKVGNDTVLNHIIEQVKQATMHKPNIQRLGDVVSAWFVPVVIVFSISTFLISYFVADVTLQQSFLSSIAVLVISCPCAMGLATPTAVAVGIGRAARDGILIKGGDTLEKFANIKTMVLDKTGTLTNGKFSITNINYLHQDKELIHYLIAQLEQHSTHPIGKALVEQIKPKEGAVKINFKFIEEEKGFGVKAGDLEGNIYSIGSFATVKDFTTDDTHQVYLNKNKELLATIDLSDTLREDAIATIEYFRSQNVKLVLLSGDNANNCERIARQLNITTVYFGHLPHEKTTIISKLKIEGLLAMAGDGINDAPSLTLADVGVTFRAATQIAIQSADIVLMNESDLFSICGAHQLAKATLKTIKQNLFWALIYNIVAIPIAAFGLLSPMIGSLSMAFSDVVVIGNSLRLRIRRIVN